MLSRGGCGVGRTASSVSDAHVASALRLSCSCLLAALWPRAYYLYVYPRPHVPEVRQALLQAYSRAGCDSLALGNSRALVRLFAGSTHTRTRRTCSPIAVRAPCAHCTHALCAVATRMCAVATNDLTNLGKRVTWEIMLFRR